MISNAIRIAALVLLFACASHHAAVAAPTRAAVSEPLRLEGTLSVLIADDFKAKRASAKYSLVVRPGYRVPIEFRGPAPANLRTGMKVQANGLFDGRSLHIDDPSGFRVLDATPTAAPTQIAHKALVMLVDVLDGTNTVQRVDQSCDASDDSADIMFGTKTTEPNVDGGYLESSFGKEGVGGAAYPGTALDVLRVQVGDPTLNFAGTCNYDSWANQADALAAAAGMNPGDYSHRVYVLPQASGCSWGGLGEVACGTDCRSWQNTYWFYLCGTRGAHAHEIGHNRGFKHASTDANNDGVVDSEYGDSSDFMGDNFDTIQHSNAPHKIQLGWIDNAHVVDGTAGGTFTIAAAELVNPALPQAIKVTPASGRPYYLSYRAPIGYDNNAPGLDYRLRTSVHRWSGGISNTLLVKTLADGESLYDAANLLFVRQVSHTATSAVVQVVPNASCTRAAPSVAINPGTQTMTAVPGTVHYAVTVTNNDTIACAESNIGFTAGYAGNWLPVSYSPGWATIQPGASYTFDVTVSPNAAQAEGSYTVVAGTNPDSFHAQVLANAGLVIDFPNTCVRATPQGTLSSPSQDALALPSSHGFNAWIRNKDSGTDCGPTTFNFTGSVPAGWGLSIDPNLTLAPGQEDSMGWTITVPAGTANGSYPFSISTLADANHASTTMNGSIVVNVSAPCVWNAPLVSLSPTSQTATALPASKNYTVTVTNRDTGPCATMQWPLSGVVPTGWGKAFAPQVLALGPGQSGSATFTVTAPASARNNSFTVRAGVEADGVHATTLASATLVVNVPSGTCSVGTPIVALSPSTQTATSLPKALAYTLTVTNKDSSACANASFPLVVQPPAGWGGSSSVSSLTLGPGKSGTATVTITAPAGTGNLTYGFSAGTATGGGHAGVLANGSAVVNVTPPDTTPPTAPFSLTGSINAGGKVVLNWGPSGDSGSGMLEYRIFRNGVQWATAINATLTKAITKGTWTFYVVAVDKAGNVSAPSNTVTVTK